VTDGDTGFVVTPDDVDGLIDAVARISTIERQHCRDRVEQFFSTDALGRRVDAWFRDVIASAARDHH